MHFLLMLCHGYMYKAEAKEGQNMTDIISIISAFSVFKHYIFIVLEISVNFKDLNF